MQRYFLHNRNRYASEAINKEKLKQEKILTLSKTSTLTRSTLGLCDTVLVRVSEAAFRPNTREQFWLLCDGT